MSDNTLRQCNSATCRHQRGRWQPLDHFRAANGRLLKTCADCRAYHVAKSQVYRRRRERYAGHEANAPSAEYRRGLAGWLLGLITRRQGPPRQF